MKRNAISDLINWKNSADRKPLVMRGARQVGKTWLMREFGQSCYSGFVYFNFDEEDELKSIFETNKNPQRIVELLSLIAGEKILPGETLIIFDEIQECPEALNSLNTSSRKPMIPCHCSRKPACSTEVLSGGHGQLAGPLSTDL